MAKSHVIILSITNNTGFELLNPSSWFDSGRLADGWSWPTSIPGNGAETKVECYERDWALAGCSGYVTYNWQSGSITFAFSNPDMGKNKVGVGTGGKSVWDNMDSHDYNQFTEKFTVTNVALTAVCSCTGGDTNMAKVTLSVAN